MEFGREKIKQIKRLMVLADWADRLGSTEIKWDEVLNNLIHFLKSGAGDMLDSAFS